MKRKTVNKLKPNPKLFENSKVGYSTFRPLQHKDGTDYDDVDYFELLGRKCLEMDKENKNPSIPTDYGNYDPNAVALGKEVVKGIDNGMTKKELKQYIARCVDFNS